MSFLKLVVLAAFTMNARAILAGDPLLLPSDAAALVVETEWGEQRFSIEVADEPAEWRRGLMFRTTMADDHGMLFVFDDSQPRGFWMENTPMPLDLLFVGEDGKVRAIEEGQPSSTTPIAPTVAAHFVLELKAGTAQRAGIQLGARLRHPLIDTVVSHRLQRL
ncbi:DUF192 domain-containing protein [Sinorhizobium sp. 7-81]|uniref:DUF192 domain-containing protein n=1 Tax=unclassified Sinorhizobium TaxID=2613772 RepID=UPI0024C2ED2D|nr:MULTISPECIES: DUF192 domain-containing protein [unclassified Sinorhizobium]MDK1389994.1 DUF192 domain-containing protein [Sinorhizobium sp. 7-81]MDK1494614.1 DUF192 domain-containing protein [Sinorhizobium sp. 8-89]